LIQDVCPRLLEKGTPHLSKLDRIGQRDTSRDVRHFAYHFQRWIFAAPWLEIEAQRLGQSDLRDTIIILRRNQ
jgi:hypothetical protein